MTAAGSMPDGVTELTNTASITDDGTNGADGNPADNTASDTTPVQVQTSTTVDPAAAQYSDLGSLRAAVSPAIFGSNAISGSVEFFIDGLSVGTAPVESGSNALTVTRENAAVTAADSNPLAVQVTTKGGTANFSLSALVTEVADGSPGDIANAQPVTFTLTPLGPGSTYTCTASTSGGGVGSTLTATCSFTSIPVNVYEVHMEVGGLYYAGAGETVVTVFDPSLGHVTGGGTIDRNGVKATFGFSVKTLKSGVAQGSLLYIEHRPEGDLVLKSNALLPLAIVENMAFIQGKATLGGVGNYTFIATVVDEGEPGSSDRFGLRVTDPDGNDVADLNFDPFLLTGGNIQVPLGSSGKSKK